MATSRDEFLQRVRQAVSAGNRPGSTTAVGPRGAVGYQGAGPDPVARFRDEFTAAGGHAQLVADRSAAAAKALELAQAQAVKRVLVGGGALLESLNLLEPLRGLGMEVSSVQALQPETGREAFFQADLGISGVDYLVAETGSIALLARPGEPRSLSLLPPVHIAVAERSQLVPDLFDLFEALGAHEGEATTQPALPSCVTLVTGPSKTGDIELRLVTGVHGPGELHVILITG
ncbi:MAG TPA: lactate utilization protein [Gemmataceae bacterium]|jgi:L-lactate utilization protein LutC|nr:lactate utilization protein [Gemmataceae bacterium]